MPAKDEPIPIADLASRLMTAGGVVGVVLGGSRARGCHDPDSDYDVGVYYDGDDSLDVSSLDRIAAEFDDERGPGLFAPPGGWGKWVNGGAWLTVGGRRVDVILRDLRRVEKAVADCLAGVVAAHYQPGHPHAFVDAMYAGELSVARVLAERDGRLRLLRRKTVPYPPALQRAMLSIFDFEAGFSLALAAAYADRDDDYYVAAHILRSLSCLNQVLFAVNGEYCLNEKKAVRLIDGFPLKPSGYRDRVSAVVALAGRDNAQACRELEALLAAARTLFPTTA